MSALAAIVLAGGRGRRMGGIAKPMLELGGVTLLDRTTDAVRRAGCTEIVIVAPVPIGAGVREGVSWVQEQPPFGGPVAGLAAALPRIHAERVLLLPADLVSPADAVTALVDVPPVGDGCYLVDDEGRAQWLTGAFRVAALRARVEAFPDGVHGLPARVLLDGLRLAPVSAGSATTADIDTWEHFREARRRVAAGTETDVTDSPRTLPPEALDAWAAALRERFGLTEADLPVALILDLARDVANGVARPAAPFSAFVAGLVAGRAGGSPAQVEEAVAEITRLADGWKRGDR